MLSLWVVASEKHPKKTQKCSWGFRIGKGKFSEFASFSDGRGFSCLSKS